MANFPSSIKPRMNSSESTKYNVLKNTFESNYLQVRKVSTRGRKVFVLKYDSITNDEFDTLQDFFDTYVGTVFNFTHPLTSEVYQVTFQDASLERTFITQTRCSTTINLEGI